MPRRLFSSPLAILTLLFSSALALRLWGITWGMPLKFAHVDESIVTFYSLRVVAGDPNPRVFFDYPSLFLYLLAAVFQIVLSLGVLWGKIASVPQAMTAYLEGDSVVFTLSARLLNVFLGMLTVLLVYHMGRLWAEEFGFDRRETPPDPGKPLFIGAAAAAFLAVNRLHVLQAHYGTVDVPAALFSLLALHQTLLFWKTNSLKTGLWAAGMIGLAASVKYYPAVFAGLLLPAPFVLKMRRPWKYAVFFLGAAAAGFFIGCPYALLTPHEFSARFFHLFPKIVWSAQTGGAPLFLPTLGHILKNTGSPLLLLALYGLTGTLRRKNAVARVLAAAAGVLVLFFGTWATQLEHYAMAAYPLLFLFAAQGLWELKSLHRAAPAVAAGLLVAWTALPTFRQLQVLSQPDTRLTAYRWISQNIPPGSRLLRFAHTPEFRHTDPYSVQVDWENKRLLETLEPSEFVKSFDFVIYSSYRPGDDDLLPRIKHNFPLVGEFHGPAPRFPHHPAIYVFQTKKDIS